MRSIKTITNEAIFNNSAFITGITLVAGNAAATITLDDSTDGSGSDLAGIKVVANDSKHFAYGEKGVKFDTGVYSTITGSGAVAFIYYR